MKAIHHPHQHVPRLRHAPRPDWDYGLLTHLASEKNVALGIRSPTTP
jgi:hypothetical protein